MPPPFTENELEIHARLDALEFLIARLYRLKAQQAENPSEFALTEQAATAQLLQGRIGKAKHETERLFLSQSAQHINRVLEKVVTYLEQKTDPRHKK